MNQEQQLYDKLLKKVNEYCLGYAAEDVIAAIDALVESYETPKVPSSTPSEALDSIIETFIDKDSEDIKTVRTALKALEIIKKKCPFFNLFSDEDNFCPKGHYRVYDNELYQFNELTKEEYELLKEILK